MAGCIAAAQDQIGKTPARGRHLWQPYHFRLTVSGCEGPSELKIDDDNHSFKWSV